MWSAPKPAPKPAPEPAPLPADVVQGRAGRYTCRSISSLDIHLVQIAKRMIACETVEEMDGLLEDRDKLLERRLELAAAGRTPAAMPSLSDAA